MADDVFCERYWGDEPARPDDERDPYLRDKSRILHSAAFRRLQAKTQVMGVGEGDYHRTRLTHSVEVAQIGEGIVTKLRSQYAEGTEIRRWLPSNDLIAAACYAHDLGHPPFGHGGERALHRKMHLHGGFEGNGQTLRILTRLEKYREHQGMNPTRRSLLAVLKYPAPYSAFDRKNYERKPPKCYFDEESQIVDWILSAPFQNADTVKFKRERQNDKPSHRSFDCSIMECADDIAYGVHDLDDVIARRMVKADDIVGRLELVFKSYGPKIGDGDKAVSLEDFRSKLGGRSSERKSLIGKLVNLFITSARVMHVTGFQHPLFRLKAHFDEPVAALLETLKDATYDLVTQRAEIQQLEFRGQKIVEDLYDALVTDPQRLIPRSAWESLDECDSVERRVCDYIAGMTDPYAERIYKRLFIPGVGSSRDEL